jgi:hypothetical protein
LDGDTPDGAELDGAELDGGGLVKGALDGGALGLAVGDAEEIGALAAGEFESFDVQPAIAATTTATTATIRVETTELIALSCPISGVAPPQMRGQSGDET